MKTGYLLLKTGSTMPYALLREYDDFGLDAVDIVAPPRRFWSDQETIDGCVEVGIQANRVRPLTSPASLLNALPSGENWPSHSRRSVGRLQAHFLICEDPQRRMDAREVETLSHQVSLVRHVLHNESLRRVMIADEVGLGKTVEAGLIIRELLEQRPELRILYLAPARLVNNVLSEFDRLKLPFRRWSAQGADARLSDNMVVASIHRAVHKGHFDSIAQSKPWDVIIVDECHHLSAWEQDGGKPSQAYKLVQALIERQGDSGRVILMSGTPHQGHQTRFENLLALLKLSGEDSRMLTGRVIYRTKDDIRDWDGNPVFPNRQVNEPVIVNLGPQHRTWMDAIHDFYRPPPESSMGQARRRATGWRCAQAMQWAASSPQAGLGYLTRQAVRANWKSSDPTLRDALAALRPYRLGSTDEPVDALYQRIYAEIDRQDREDDVDDIEDFIPGDPRDSGSAAGLKRLISQGIDLVRNAGDDKWLIIWNQLLAGAAGEKAVLFAQPIETVSALARFLERATGRAPAMIIGGQDDTQRQEQVAAFKRLDGPQFLVSSRAGGEGINLQVSRRLIHIDVPWNPMDMEQRVGRVHRFGSKETIIVDTVVVEDSREADAFRIAREKLKLITRTLVEPERFEAVFSRVMCLVSQDELQDLMLNNSAAPFSDTDQERLATMVQNGFQAWKRFHVRFGDQQRSIQSQNPGLLQWDDIAAFYEQYDDAVPEPGHKTTRFRTNGAAVSRVEEDAKVFSFQSGQAFVFDEHSDALVYGPDGNPTPKFGLNRPEAAEVLRRIAFPAQFAGAAWLRWPDDTPLPNGLSAGAFGTLVLLKQTLRRDTSGFWTELGQTLHAYMITADSCREEEDESRGSLLRAVFRSGIRKGPDAESHALLDNLQRNEVLLCETLRQPTPEELENKVRHGVTPIFAAILSR
jgi:superfamily II DNA or RNA helicase